MKHDSFPLQSTVLISLFTTSLSPSGGGGVGGGEVDVISSNELNACVSSEWDVPSVGRTVDAACRSPPAQLYPRGPD